MSGFGTRAVHGNIFKDNRTIHLHSIQDEISAIENDTKQRLEERIATLEHAKYALCYSSGMAAITSITMLLEDGDHVVAFHSIYHGTRTYLEIRESLGNLEVTFSDLQDASMLENLMKDNTKMVWIETPCNPTMKIVDIEAISKIVKRHKKSFLVVDNTFMTPYFQNPLVLGADVVVHSLTKYLNGHTDVLMGAAATNSEEIYTKLKNTSKLIGSLPSPVDCFLALRGLRTLHIRMERHMKNATEIAHFLETHPNVEKVFYPGLKNHPGHEIALKQSKGFSGMVSFCINGGAQAAKIFAQRIQIFTLGGSLGGCESLVDISSLMTVKAVDKKHREEMGITDNLIRLSIGLEATNDLIADLEQALQ